MLVILETKNFIVRSSEHPLVDRLDGGHIVIVPKAPVEDRTKLSPEIAKEVMKLTMVVGEAMITALKKRGIDIGRINYQDNGNWTPTFHIHLFGRAKSATRQKYGEALYLPKRETGFYKNCNQLNEDDVAEIKKEVERIMTSEKYRNF